MAPRVWRTECGLLVSGGAALPEDLVVHLHRRGHSDHSGIRIDGNVAGDHDQQRSTTIASGTVGKAIPNVEIRIAADGEIEVRGPNVMRGYYNKPEETRAVFTRMVGSRPATSARIDKDGFLRITDRKKELFKTSGGKYIAPQPIEQAIKGSRFVNQVVLIGAGRKFPAALIVPVWEQIESYCKLKGIEVKSRERAVPASAHHRFVSATDRRADAESRASTNGSRKSRCWKTSSRSKAAS